MYALFGLVQECCFALGQSDIASAFQGHCCSASFLCPNKADFFLEESTQIPRSCTVGAFITCPNGYTCQNTQAEFTTGHCCKGDVVSVSGNFIHHFLLFL